MPEAAKITLHLAAQIGEGASGTVYPIVSEGDATLMQSLWSAKEVLVESPDDVAKINGNKIASELHLVAKEVKLGDETTRDAVLKEVELLKAASKNCHGVVEYVLSGMTAGDVPSLIVVMEACRGDLWGVLTAYKASRPATPKSGTSSKPGLNRQGSGISNASTGEAGIFSQLPTEAERLCWTTLLCETVRDCHKLGVLHRDINPWNVLISRAQNADGSRKICLADFGLAVSMGARTQLSGLETEGAATLDVSALGSLYSAPELGKTYGVSADVFSLGMLLFAIWSTPDVNDEDALVCLVENLKDSLANGTAMPENMLQKASVSSFGPELRIIILSMVTADPLLRPSSAQACNQMKHCLQEYAKQSMQNSPEIEVEALAKRGALAKCCMCFYPTTTKEDA